MRPARHCGTNATWMSGPASAVGAAASRRCRGRGFPRPWRVRYLRISPWKITEIIREVASFRAYDSHKKAQFSTVFAFVSMTVPICFQWPFLAVFCGLQRCSLSENRCFGLFLLKNSCRLRQCRLRGHRVQHSWSIAFSESHPVFLDTELS